MLNKKGITMMVQEYLDDFSSKDSFVLEKSSFGYFIKPSKFGKCRSSIMNRLEEILVCEFEKDSAIEFKITGNVFKFNKVSKTKRITHDSQLSILMYMGK